MALRVHALDASGSMDSYIAPALRFILKTASPQDMFVFFSYRVSQPVRIADLDFDQTYDRIRRQGMGPGQVEDVMAWMETRHLTPQDTLVVYTDSNFDWQGWQKPFYTLQIVLVEQSNPRIKNCPYLLK